jgi:predicted outer membrane protein
MKHLMMVASLALASSLACAQAQAPADNAQAPATPTQRKACEDLKAEIDAKLQKKGVTSYSLDVVANEEVKDQKVVGSCDGGTKKITYKRGA